MTPECLAKSGSESAHQMALFCWANLATYRGFAAANDLTAYGNREIIDRYGVDNAVPELSFLHHIPNGGSRGDTARTARIAGGKLKAEGVKPGVPDIFLPVRRGTWPGLYIEMKKPGAITKVSPEQVAFMDFVRAQGYGVAVCDHWRKAADVLTEYLSYK